LKCGIPSSVMMKGIGERCADPGTIPFFIVASQPARYTHSSHHKASCTHRESRTKFLHKVPWPLGHFRERSTCISRSHLSRFAA
jgi:hypothetical protein